MSEVFQLHNMSKAFRRSVAGLVAANNKDCQLPMDMAEVNSKKPSSPAGQLVGDLGPGNLR